MKKIFGKPVYWLIIAATVGLWAVSGGSMLLNPEEQTESRIAYIGLDERCSDTIIYKNGQYGFLFLLPEDWEGYKVVNDEWQGYEVQTGDVSETGPFISLRNPKWTEQKPYQDIPIYVFTLAQWDAMQRNEFHIGAAPINPSELGRNSKYVFALPARYNYAYLPGWEEVDEIIKNGALKPLEQGKLGGN
jgi:hypothetical protein